MRRVLLALLGTFVVVSSALAHALPSPTERLETSPRHHEWVDIEAPGERKVHNWVVFPEVDHPAAVVIVIHENRGLTDWVRGVADQLAEAGFIALAPDLLSGTAPGGGNTAEYGSEDAARNGIGRLPQSQVTSDLDAVFKYAREMPAGNKVVAVSGFCWGGGQSFAYATHNPDVAAAFVFYGSEPRDESAYAKIKAPVYGFYGGNDFRISGAVPKVTERMKAAGKTYEPVIYAGAGHGFMRQGETVANTENADRKARDQAWERWKRLLVRPKPVKVMSGPSAEVIRTRLVPFTTPGGVRTQMVLVDWKNTGTTIIRAADADIIPYDARGNRLDSGWKGKPIYAVDDSSPGIAPGETYVEPKGKGYILMPIDPGTPKAAKVVIKITEVVESGAY
ncbi:MAG: dienelactone hydrolase family protein [Pirellulales bacterium]